MSASVNFQKIAYENGKAVLASDRFQTIDEARQHQWGNDGMGGLSREYQIEREEIWKYEGNNHISTYPA